MEGMNKDGSGRECLSDLMDGRGDARLAEHISSRWACDEQLRADWHTYHLIGDVLRSEELARPADEDEAALQALRRRLEQEPVVLAPGPSAAHAAPAAGRQESAARRTVAWPAVAAVAGMGVLGLFLMVLQAPWSAGAGDLLALAGWRDAGLLKPGETLVSAGYPGSARVIRNSHLDRYLAAHDQFGAGSAQRGSTDLDGRAVRGLLQDDGGGLMRSALDLLPALRTVVQAQSATSPEAALDAEGWVLNPPLAGYRLVGVERRVVEQADDEGRMVPVPALQAVFSDGLTHVSVFIEPYSVHRRQALHATIGATHALTQQHAEAWVTLMGDVPEAVLGHFAQALERRR